MRKFSMAFAAFTIATFATFVLAGFLATATAHPGGMAKDGCHKKKADGGARHAHFTMKDGSKAEVKCEAFKAISASLEGKGGEALSVARDETKDMREKANSYQTRALEAEANIKAERYKANAVIAEYEGKISAIRVNHKNAVAAKAKAAKTLLEAKEVLAVAEARERGAGPPASRDCQRSIRILVTDKAAGWLSDRVKLDAADRRRIARSCLGD